MRVVALLGRFGTMFYSCAVVLSLASCGQSSSPPALDSSHPAVSYRTIEEWRIPNGGYGRAVVVDPSQRNEQALLALADQLRRDTARDRNAFIFIYDDLSAARLRKAALAESVSQSDMKVHDDHAIATYVRNANTGYHAITISLQGLAGPKQEVSLR